jgi:Phosphoesterase family
MPKHRPARPTFRPLAILAALATVAGLSVTLLTGGPASSAVVPTPAHTVIVVMENHSYSEVIKAPYIASLARGGANMTDSHAVRHPSQPNYLALWSGSTQGLTDDSCPHTFTGPSLGQQLLDTGRTTAIYSENLPLAGSLVCSASGGYARKHNPLADFPATSGAATNKPYTAWPTNFNQLPTVSMVVPNLNDDMHDGTVARGDNWLKEHVDPYVQWAKTHNSLLVLTFDEDDNTTANRIPTILVGPMVKPGNYAGTVNHYSVLHTIEVAYGLLQLGVSAAPITGIWSAGAAPSSSTVPSSSSATSATAVSSATSASATASSQPATSQPAGSSSAVPTTSPTTSGQPPPKPLRGAFYYPWFPGAWTQKGIYPYTHYHPAVGFYSSTDPALIAYQVAGMQYAGLDFAISSWWGQGSREDQAVPAELAAATGEFKWSLYYEPEGTGNPTVGQLQSDLAYLAAHYAGSPAYLTVGGRPVLFVYGDGGDSCSMATRWAQANAGRFYLVLKVFTGYRTCAAQPDSWHQYGPAVAADSQRGYSYSVSPGFWKADETSPRLARDLSRWTANLTSMVASGAPWQLITTWNEWGEGTAVEDASEWSDPGVFGAYVEAMHDTLGR